MMQEQQKQRLGRKYKKEYLDELVGILREQARDKQTLQDFLSDLLTPVERREMATRWQIVKLLSDGVTHRGVADKLNVSIATVTRGSRALQESTGGFARALQWRT
jgi:TrpR family trp operon transcriptional repressor